jgi:uncharacterized protein (DUF1015 family)
MADIRPFQAIRYAALSGLDFSRVVAPPYDVLDEAGRSALQAKDPRNIVEVDLPFMPPKSVGPDEVYERASQTLQRWLDEGVLVRDQRPGLYPYTQAYRHDGNAFNRRGFFALVRLAPFGEGQVVPHELTYRGPIEDRLRLMRATGVQLSPIFGLYSDPGNEVAGALFQRAGQPVMTALLEGVENRLWAGVDAQVEDRVTGLLRGRPIYIADGHHRYTTALQYQAEMVQRNGGPLPDNHPANWCLFVLVGMQDPGLLILPTHRLIGNLRGWDVDAFRTAISPHFELAAAPTGGDRVDVFARDLLPGQPSHTFGLFDGISRRLYQLRLKNPDVLADLEPGRSEAWRQLDVAILQRYLLDEVLGPMFAGDGGLSRGYTADPDAIGRMVDGQHYQVGLLLQSTPLAALEELGRHGEVMPQKSTYFYPKLATGMVINPLR